MSDILPLGTKVPPYGTIQMIGMLAEERYYWMVSEDGAVSMMPASVIEQKEGV